jgi:hypothetical protein
VEYRRYPFATPSTPLPGCAPFISRQTLVILFRANEIVFRANEIVDKIP